MGCVPSGGGGDDDDDGGDDDDYDGDEYMMTKNMVASTEAL